MGEDRQRKCLERKAVEEVIADRRGTKKGVETMRRLRLFFLWVLGTSFGPVLAAWLASAVYLGVLPALQCETVSDMIHPIVWRPACHAVLWSAMALCVAVPGLLQWAVLRGQGVLRKAWWIPLTALGWVGVLAFVLRLPQDDLGLGDSVVFLMVIFAFAGVILGIPQWIALRGLSARAWIWIPVTAAGTLLAGPLGRVDIVTWRGLLALLLNLLPYGILTGLLLVWLSHEGAGRSQRSPARYL